MGIRGAVGFLFDCCSYFRQLYQQVDLVSPAFNLLFKEINSSLPLLKDSGDTDSGSMRLNYGHNPWVIG